MLRWRTVEDEPQGVLFADEEVVERHVGRGEFRGLEFFHVRCRTIVNTVPAASRMPFTHTINAYRGCSHACVYCFARPTHHYLGLGIGEDFERKIVVKVNAVERLRAELASPRWHGQAIAMGTNTDPYQRAEGKYHLTQGIVSELAEAANPFSILTKSTLILRDLDLLVIPCGVLVAPVLPGLSDADEQLIDVVDACVDAGATSITAMYLHLRPGVREHWFEWMARALPDRVTDYERRYRNRAYVPKQVQHQLTTRVDGLVRAARQRRSARGRAPRAPATRRGPPCR